MKLKDNQIKIHSPQNFNVLIQQERARVNRNGRNFTVVLFHLADRAAGSSKLQPNLLKAIAKRIRSIDQLGMYDKYTVGLLLPHTDSNGAHKIVDELNRNPDVVGNIMKCDFYGYP